MRSRCFVSSCEHVITAIAVLLIVSILACLQSTQTQPILAADIIHILPVEIKSFDVTGRCKSPPTIPHATHREPASQHDANSWREDEGRLYRLGTELIYTCARGYYMDGYYKARCMGEGHWVGPTMRCLR